MTNVAPGYDPCGQSVTAPPPRNLGRHLTMRLGLVAWLVAATQAAEPAGRDKFAAVFAPAELGHARLAPDGRHLAYWFRERNEMFVGVLDIDAAAVTMRQSIGPEREEPLGTILPAALNAVGHLSWISPRRLVIQTTNRGVVALDADGRNPAWLVDPRKNPWIHTRSLPSPPLSDPTGTLPYSFPAASYPRRVRLVGAPPGNFVTVEASNYAPMSTRDRELEVFRINTANGKAQRTFEDTIAGRLFYDQQGRPRLLLSEAKSPPRFLYNAAEAGRPAWKPLGEQLRGASSEFEVTADAFFRPRSVPLAFDVDPDVLYIGSNVGRDTMGVYGLNVKTGQRTRVAIEIAGYDAIEPESLSPETALVFDRFTQKLAGVRVRGVKATTAWADAELAGVQRQLEQKMPRHSLLVEDWDEKRDRFLVRAFNRTDPGGFLVYTKSTDQLRSYLSLAKPSPAPRQIVTTPWMRRLADGRMLSGNLMRPVGASTAAIPTVLYMPDPWSAADAGYNPEVAALCQMGVAVLEVSTRGSQGRGLSNWLAGRENLDRVVAEDYLAALDALATEAGLDRENVAAFGRGFEGTLALRLMQLHPDRLRAVVALDPVTDLSGWLQARSSSSAVLEAQYAKRRAYFGTDATRLKAQSPETHPEQLVKPLLLAAVSGYPAPGVEPRKLRNLVRSAGRAPQWVESSVERPGPASRTELFEAIEKFLTAELRVKADR